MLAGIFYKLFAIAQFAYNGFVCANLCAFTTSIFKIFLKGDTPVDS